MKELVDFIMSDIIYMIISVSIALLTIVLIILISKLLKESSRSNSVTKVNSKNINNIARRKDLIDRGIDEESIARSKVSNRTNLKAEVINRIQSDNKFDETEVLSGDLPYSDSGETQLLTQPKIKILASLSINENGQINKFNIIKAVSNIGRDPEICDITILNDNHIGRKHALIYKRDDKFYLTDLNSKNGTFINGERIQGEREIHDCDVIKLAATELIFKIC